MEENISLTFDEPEPVQTIKVLSRIENILKSCYFRSQVGLPGGKKEESRLAVMIGAAAAAAFFLLLLFLLLCCCCCRRRRVKGHQVRRIKKGNNMNVYLRNYFVFSGRLQQFFHLLRQQRQDP